MRGDSAPPSNYGASGRGPSQRDGDRSIAHWLDPVASRRRAGLQSSRGSGSRRTRGARSARASAPDAEGAVEQELDAQPAPPQVLCVPARSVS
eukprot:1597654-Pyramimonas_sp.AAC.1